MEGIDLQYHSKGDIKCEACWSNYPKKHVECGGLIHAEFGDENKDCEYWLYYRCDKCEEYISQSLIYYNVEET